jgi:hypothetical protein
MDGRAAGLIPEDAQHVLVTTAAVADGSAAASLTPGHRDEAGALGRLLGVATTSANATNQPAYRRFAALSDDGRWALLRCTTVLAGSPDIADVGSRLTEAARLIVRREHVEHLLSRLEGWWYRRVVEQLVDRRKPPLLSVELEAQIDDLREQFRRDALPLDEDILADQVQDEAYRDYVFVRQAGLAGIGNARILAAIRDY